MLKLIIPPPIYAIIFAISMWVLDRYFPLLQMIPDAYEKIGFVPMTIALFIDFWALSLFFRSRTSPNPMKPEKASELVTAGLYGFSRNPMYFALLLLLTGWAINLGSLSPFLLLPLFVLILTSQQIISEEQVLEEKFGQVYLDYKQKVRRWI